MAHTCPIIGCVHRPGRDTAGDLLMCRRHWLMVPWSLQQTVRQAWSAYSLAKKAGRMASRKASGKYFEARRLAIVEVNSKLRRMGAFKGGDL